MELRVEELQLPQEIRFNYDELKKELSEKVKLYETLVYSDDQIKSAKADRADLNRLKKALNDERIRREKEYMKPFNEFKAQINEIIGIIDKPVALIDKQIKEYEEQQKQEKKQGIEHRFINIQHPDWLELSQIWNPKWLNSTFSITAVADEICEKMTQIKNDLITLSELPEFAFEAIETYKTTLDLNKSIAEGHRLSDMQKRKVENERIRAEHEKVRAEQERLRKEQEERARKAMPKATAEPFSGAAESPLESEVRNYNLTAPDKFDGTIIREWVSFKAFIDIEDARALAEFFKRRNIEFKRI